MEQSPASTLTGRRGERCGPYAAWVAPWRRNCINAVCRWSHARLAVCEPGTLSPAGAVEALSRKRPVCARIELPTRRTAFRAVLGVRAAWGVETAISSAPLFWRAAKLLSSSRCA